MYDYLILTAAVTRPDLHGMLFHEHLQLVGNASVKWLIHIDDVDSGHSVAETVAQFERLLDAPNIDVEFLHRDGPGCFFRAARALATRAAALLDECRTGVVWLEDDWALQRAGPAARLLTAARLRLSRNRAGGRVRRCPGDLAAKQSWLDDHERHGHAHWFVSLVPRSRVSFNPGIWSKALFREAFYETLARAGDRVDDPETLCADPLNEPSRYAGLRVFVDPRFQDAGRLWSAAAGLRKWHKDAAGLQAAGAVSYAPRTASRGRFSLEPAPLCPDLLLGSPLRILCRTQEGDIVRLQIRGVPSVAFDVIPVTHERAEVYMHRLHAWSRTYPVKRAPICLQRGQDGIWIEDSAGRRAPLPPAGLLDHAWRPWAQAVLGVLALVVGLPKVLTRLDAE